MRALRRKNGFPPGLPPEGIRQGGAGAALAGGYRDINYNLLFQSPSVRGAMGRVIVEVQVIVEA